MVDRICDNCMSRVPADSDKCPQCGIRFENTNPGGALPNGWVLGGRYTIGRYIEIDGEGVTYSAIDGNTLQRITIKEYMPVTLCATRDEYGAIVPKPGNEVLFKTTKMDFRELYDTLLRMGLTEGLLQVLDVLEENNTAYAVLEKVEGPTLAEYLTKTGEPMEANRAMAVMRPIMMGVEAMHTANLVHRGISPENIILESGGTAKLGGYATLALRQQGSELKPKLYPGYSAPEQYSASEFEGRYTDIYALGAVLYRIVTLEVPTPADERKMQDTLRPARQYNKDIPGFLSGGIARAMRLVPAERLQNIADLRLALTGEGGRGARGPLGLSKSQLIVGACALGAIVLLLLVVLFVNIFGGRSDEPSSSLPSTTSDMSSSVPEVENPLPNFEGQTWLFVKNKYEPDGYNFKVTERYDSTVTEGYIISQDPEAGIEYTGQTINLEVSLGKDPTADMVYMPDVVTSKMTREQAQQALNQAIAAAGIDMQLVATVVEETNDGSYDEGIVVRTDPVAGTTFDPTSDTVTFYVAGEKPVKLPNLQGMSFDAAAAELKRLGIPYSDAASWDVNDGQYVPNTVSRVTLNGNALSSGDNVYISGDSLTIHLAASVSLPNVVGMTETEARNALNALATGASKTSLSIIVEKVNSAGTPGTVSSMTPDARSEVNSGDTVTLYVIDEPSGTASGAGD